jgi:pimeloyl-ACP methyl ester carboxylesterase
MIRYVVSFICWILIASFSRFAYPMESQSNRKAVEQVVHSLGLDQKASQQDIAELADLKTKAEAPNLTDQERLQAYKSLFAFMCKLEGMDAPDSFLESKAQIAVGWSPTIHKTQTVFPSVQLAHVETRGTGKIPMILIPDIGYSWNVFESFVQRNSTRYKMYAITLPGFAGTGSPKTPELRDYTQMPLWKNAEAAVLKLIETEKLNKPILVGHQAGGYLAMKLALDHPEMIGSVVVMNALLYMPLPSHSDPSKPASAEERAERLKKSLPIELFPYPSNFRYQKSMEQYGPMFCKDPQRQQFLLQMLSSSDAHTSWNYFAELMSTDLSSDIKTLNVPLLSIPSVPDEKLEGGAENFKINSTQWENLNVSLITVVPFKDTRAFVTEDNPLQLDSAISNFVTSHGSR